MSMAPTRQAQQSGQLCQAGRRGDLPSFLREDGGRATKRGRRHWAIYTFCIKSSGREFYFVVWTVNTRTVSNNQEKGCVQTLGNYTQIQALSESTWKIDPQIPQYTTANDRWYVVWGAFLYPSPSLVTWRVTWTASQLASLACAGPKRARHQHYTQV